MVFALLKKDEENNPFFKWFSEILYFLMLGLIIALLLLRLTSPQNNPVCKAKRYQCSIDPITEPDICVKVIDEQEKYIMLKKCESLAKPFCPYDKASYGSPALCQASQTQAGGLIPGDECTQHTQCLSIICNNGKCQGKEYGESCKLHEDCGAGLYCGIDRYCITQREFDQSCTSDYECVNNCVCNMGKCAFYYSFDTGAVADNTMACNSGYIGSNNTCEPGLKSRYPGNPCTYDIDCEYVNADGVVAKTGICACGYNAGAYSYCPLETGDQEFKDMVRAIRFLAARNLKCHTLRRFGPCTELYDDEYNDYHFKLQKYYSYPKLIGNDDCVKKIYNWDFWKYQSWAFLYSPVMCALLIISF